MIGGGAVGCEVAFWLASEHGKQVTVVEMLPQFMAGNCTANRGYLLHYLEALGVRLLNCARVESIDETGVAIVRNVSPTVPDPYVTWAPLPPANIRNPLARSIRVRDAEQRIAGRPGRPGHRSRHRRRAFTRSAFVATSRPSCTTSATRSP